MPPKKRKYTKRDQMMLTLRAMQKLMTKQMEVSELQARVMEKFLDGFKIDGPPEVRVMNDADEFKLEQDRFADNPNMKAFPSPNWVVMNND